MRLTRRRLVMNGGKICAALALAGPLYLASAPSKQSQAAVNGQVAMAHIQALSQNAIATLGRGDMSLQQREVALHHLLQQGFDITLIGRIVLGKAWRKATPEQQRDYLQLFTVYVVRTFANRLAGYAGETVTVLGSRPTGKKDVLVDSQINRPGGSPIQAAWRVREIQGQPRVIDVMVEGVSLALTQRDDFAAIVKKNGITGLIEVLRAKTQRLSAQSG